ncbi:hypothetical protein PWEIH_08501 [Listeria weihenstephanensis FSL R9-0317]|uniref:Uncharacterized protein n=1 Tax=Listeria weihenstephanensis TaxID=1006155 RepID=A0A1S7FQI5_9LIST|nr:hypothetical protein [Listeria weihenstephanensis]AQY49615.1 hypothetical protein UE46_00065 [Listeria weihenstephanensis]EUJ39059.1 hypothetical protein PWEIH_08501 [Listeria weihenstephanensis FSL R9-0317]
MRRKMKRVGLLIVAAVLVVLAVLAPTMGKAAQNDYRYLYIGTDHAGVQGSNSWYTDNWGTEYFGGSTKVDSVKWSSNNEQWTKSHARYGSTYGAGSSYSVEFKGNAARCIPTVEIYYKDHPKGFLGAYSEHSRNDKETAWRELAGRW